MNGGKRDGDQDDDDGESQKFNTANNCKKIDGQTDRYFPVPGNG